MLLIAATTTATAADNTLSLTMKEAIRMGVEKNLDVRAELYNPAMFEADINRNKSIYDPLFAVQTTYTDSTSKSAATATADTYNQHSLEFDSSLSRLFWTGASAKISLYNNYNDNNFVSSSTGLANYWQSSLGVTLNQPLLKYLGRQNTEININVSRLSKFASIEHFNTDSSTDGRPGQV